jgi:myo-inositol-1-phosphate synthase
MEAGAMRLAIVGIGNNASALVQGIAYYDGEWEGPLPGVSRTFLGGIKITDVEIVAAFDVSSNKIGKRVVDAIFCPPNNYPDLGVTSVHASPCVSPGIDAPDDQEQIRGVADVLKKQQADVLLYSLPTGLPAMARAYAEAAIAAGVAVVNCTPDPIAGVPELMARAQEENIPLVGDDLQSHFGSSVVHGALLALLKERGVTLVGSYQLNVGGNADFNNLRSMGQGKERSKHRALRQKISSTDSVTVVPSAGFVPYLADRKVGLMSVEGRGWANMPVKIDVQLQVQDSSNAAGVIIDLVRIAALARERGEGGFPVAATPLLKSPHLVEDAQAQVKHGQELLASLADDRDD